MARSTSAIQNSIKAQIAADPVLGTQLTSTSQVAIWNDWTYIIATAMNAEEVNSDTFIANAESAISSNPPANATWVLRYALAFQYSATTPQVVQLNTTTLVPGYSITNTSLQIISRVAVVSPYINTAGLVVNGTPGVVVIKVATGTTTPSALSGAQLSAFQNYLNIIKPGGLIYKAISVAADLLMCNVMIYYQGIYSAVIKANVYSAYTTFINNIPFNGVLKVSDLEAVLRNVTGVNDIEFISVNYRTTGTTLTAPYNMINNYTQLLKDTTGLGLAGYSIDETTGGFDFLTLNASNFIAQ